MAELTLAQLVADGLQKHQAGRIAEAEAIYRRVLEIDPKHHETLHFMGILMGQRGRSKEAVEFIAKAVEISPMSYVYLSNLGKFLIDLDRFEEAAAACRKSIQINGNFAAAHRNLGIAMFRLQRIDEALRAFYRVLEINPDAPDISQDLARVYDFIDTHVDVIGNARKSIAALPTDMSAYDRLSVALWRKARFEEMRQVCRDAIKVKPDDPGANFRLGVANLALGDYENGWPLYENRWKTPHLGLVKMGPFPQPEWKGEPIAGKTLLVWIEQGMGDNIQFVRYATMVRELGGKVILAMPPQLHKLLATCPGVELVLPDTRLAPPFDYHIPMMSLPSVFKTTVATIPNKTPYLFPDAALIESWKQRFPFPANKLKVGLVWSGGGKHRDDMLRSLSLLDFGAFTAARNTQFYSLQVGEKALKPAFVPTGMNILDPAAAIKDFADTAAIITQLDLVITVDTSVAHVAGAVGKPVWTLIRYVPDWRWMLNRTDTPWYPTMKLFRQTTDRDWKEVTKQLAKELLVLAEGRI